MHAAASSARCDERGRCPRGWWCWRFVDGVSPPSRLWVFDDYSRVACVEALDDEKADTLAGFWRRAQERFWANDPAVDEILTDNGPNSCSTKFAELLAERAIKHRRTQPYRPQTNGKAERFNRTLADEFLYARVFKSESDRRIRLARWAHDYNCHPHHIAIGGPPATRAHNLTRTDMRVRVRGVAARSRLD